MNSQNLIWLLVILGFPVFILIGFLLSENQASKLKALAQKRGWRIQPHPKEHRDYLFESQQGGIRWRMEYYWIGAKKVSSYRRNIPVVVWKTSEAHLEEGALALCARPLRIKHFTPPLMSGSESRMDDEQAESAFSSLAEYRFGAMDLDERFSLRVSDPGLLPFIKSSLASSLLSWHDPIHQMGGPVILADATGLTVWWIAFGVRPEWLEQTVDLGLALADRLR